MIILRLKILFVKNRLQSDATAKGNAYSGDSSSVFLNSNVFTLVLTTDLFRGPETTVNFVSKLLDSLCLHTSW